MSVPALHLQSISVSVQILRREKLQGTLTHVVRVCLCSKELISVTLAVSVSEEHLFVPRTKGGSHPLEEATQVNTVLPDACQEDLRRAWLLLPPCQEQVPRGHLLDAEES